MCQRLLNRGAVVLMNANTAIEVLTNILIQAVGTPVCVAGYPLPGSERSAANRRLGLRPIWRIRREVTPTVERGDAPRLRRVCGGFGMLV